MVGAVTSLSLPHLSERPFRAPPGGSLLEFLRPRLLSTAVPQSVPAFLPQMPGGTPPLRRTCALGPATPSLPPAPSDVGGRREVIMIDKRLQITVAQGSILGVEAEAIVNAANSQGYMGGGVAGVIKRAAGV